MLYLNPIIDNQDTNLADVYRKTVREAEEARISTGYFYISGFNLLKDDLENLADPEELGRAPLVSLWVQLGRTHRQNTK